MMNEKQAEQLLKTIGISSGIVVAIFIIVTISLMYKNYLEIQKLRLQITALKGNVKIGD
jgi:hypothetical protein